MTKSPMPGIEEVVQSQLDAYNARDIDLFMTAWANDAQYFVHPSTLLAEGADTIRERHLERFKEPDLFGKLIKRSIIGNTVIDIETVTRNFPKGKGQLEVACIYEVLSGKISKAWFILGEPVYETGV